MCVRLTQKLDRINKILKQDNAKKSLKSIDSECKRGKFMFKKTVFNINKCLAWIFKTTF